LYPGRILSYSRLRNGQT